MPVSLKQRRVLVGGLLAGGLLGSAPALAAEGGGGAQALLTPHIGTVFWTLVTFILMVIILGRYAWKPLLGALDARESGIRDTIDQARQDRESAEALVEEQRQLLAEAHRQRSEALEQGRQDAEKVKAEMLAEAQRQRELLLKQTEEQVQAGMRQAQAELRGVAVDLALQAAEKLLAKNLDGDTQRKLVEEYLTDLERNGGGSATPPS